MTIHEKLSAIQQEIKAPKSLWSKFGNYYYRNAEGILEAVKPYEAKYKVLFLIGDEIVQVGDRYYIRATAAIVDLESEKQESISATAYAREPESKKGMDESQVTGATSSYARKYALNGLLLLDDTKDADTDENRVEAENRAKQDAMRDGGTQVASKYVTEPMIRSLKNELRRVGKTDTELLTYLKADKFKDITIEQYKSVMDDMAKAPTPEVRVDDVQRELPFE